ncbi:MAG: CRISPR-associated endonuclease Cas1 [Selenomonas sp.]|nr:CRISPR-associated endonuclease Cas1 [Selenomonas sp.]MBQ4211919.1 CRISPR-associated endonuclease Cas1 [Selenomonas sp.]
MKNCEPFFIVLWGRIYSTICGTLSVAYTLLAHGCSSALKGVDLDAYVGFMHTKRRI